MRLGHPSLAQVDGRWELYFVGYDEADRPSLSFSIGTLTSFPLSTRAIVT